MKNFTLLWRSSMLTALLLLCGLAPLNLKAFTAAPLVTEGEEVNSLDWTSAAPGLTEFHQFAFRKALVQSVKSERTVVNTCFQGFSAGNDQANCSGETVTLDGGWDSYSGPDESTDGGGVTWAILDNSGSGSFRVGGLSQPNNTNFAGSPVGNFATSSNGLGGPVAEYIPGAGDELVQLEISTVSLSASGCDVQKDTVVLFFYPEVDVNVDGSVITFGNSTPTPLFSGADMDTPGALSVCSQEAVTLEVTNTQQTIGADPESAIIHYSYTINNPAGIGGLPGNGTGEAAEFNNVFDDLTLTNNSGNAQVATVTITAFFDRNNDNVIQTNECEGQPTVITINVQPEADASAGFDGFGNPVGVVYCSSDTAKILVTGTPNSTVVYQIDYGTGTFASADTVFLGASGTNGATNNQAADFVEILLDTLGGTRPRFNITSVEFTSGSTCKVTKNIILEFEVLPSPEGEIQLAAPADTSFCFGNLPANLNVILATDSASTFEIQVARSIDGMVVDTFTRANLMTTFATMGDDSATVAFTLPTPVMANDTGRIVSYELIAITESSSGATCPAVVSGSSFTVYQQPDAFLLLDVTPDGQSAVRVDENTPAMVTVCDETQVDFSLPTGMVDTAFFPAVDSIAPFQIRVENLQDNFNQFGFTDTFLTATDLYAAVAGLSTFIDVPNNTTSTETIELRFTPYYDQNANDTLSMGVDCIGDAVEVIINVEPALNVGFQTAPAAFPTSLGNTDSTRVCSGEDVIFTLTTNQPSIARLAVDGQTINVAINTAATGMAIGFTGSYAATNVTAQTTVTLVDVTANGSGCSELFNQSVVIYVDELPEADLALSTREICNDGEAVLSLTGTGGEGDSLRYYLTVVEPDLDSVRIDTVGIRNLSFAADRFQFSMPGPYQFFIDSVANVNMLGCTTRYPNTGLDRKRDTINVEFVPGVAITSNPLASGAINVTNDPNSSATTDLTGNEVCNQDTVSLFVSPLAFAPDSSTVTSDSLYVVLEVTRNNTSTNLPVGTQIFANRNDLDNYVLPILKQSFRNNSNFAQEVRFTVQAFYFDNSAGEPTAVGTCVGELLEFNFLVLPTPEGTIGGNQTVCYNETASIDVTGDVGATISVAIVEGSTALTVTGAQSTTTNMGGDTITITLDADGEALITTDPLTDTLRLVKFRTESALGCLDTALLPVTVAVVDSLNAFIDGTVGTTCEGSMAMIPVKGSPGGVIYYSYANNSTFIGQVTAGMDSTAMITTGPLSQDTTVNIDSIALTVMDFDGNPLRCIDSMLVGTLTIDLDVEAAPSGTITVLEPVCNGTERPQVRFDLTAGLGTDFNLTIGDSTYTNVQDGAVVTLLRANAGLTNDSIFVLSKITDVTSGGNGCMSLGDTVSFDTVFVEQVPTAVATITLNGTTVMVDTSMVFRDTVCSGADFDLSVMGVPASGASRAGDSLSYIIDIADNANLIGQNVNNFPSGAFPINLTASQLSGFLDDFFPATFDNSSGSAATVIVSFTPYYETGTPAPGSGNGPTVSNACPGPSTVFEITVADSLSADFVDADNRTDICEGSTATILLTGDPNIEVTLFDSAAARTETVLLDGMGNGSFTTAVLSADNAYAIAGYGTTTQMPACNTTVPFDPIYRVNVVPTPMAVVAFNNDTICEGGSRNAVITGTPGATVSFAINGIAQPDATLNGNGRITVSVPTSATGLTDLDSVIISLSAVVTGAPIACPQTLTAADTLIVRPTPNGTITAGPAVCEGDSVNIVFNSTVRPDDTYRLIIRRPDGTTVAVEPVSNGGIALRAGQNGIYRLERIRDNRDGSGGNVSCDNNQLGQTVPIDTALVIIEQEPDLKAQILGQAGNINIDNGTFGSVYRALLCNDQQFEIDFSSTTDVSRAGDSLRVMINVSQNDGDILTTFLNTVRGTTTTLDLDAVLSNTSDTSQLVAFQLVPFFENTTCTGSPLTFEITVLPELIAEVTVDPATLCVGDTTAFTISGPANAIVTYSQMGFDDLSTSNATTVTIPADGDTVIMGWDALANVSDTYLALSMIELTTQQTVCTAMLNDTARVTVNPLPTGFLTVSDAGPICNGDSVTIAFRTTFGNAGDMFTLALGDSSYTVTPVASANLPTGTRAADLFRIPLTQDSTFTLDTITYLTTGCVATPNMMVTTTVNELPEGTLTLTDEMSNSATTSASASSITQVVCTNDSLNILAAMTSMPTMSSGDANYVSVDFASDANFFGLGLRDTIALPVGDFEAAFSKRYQNQSDSVQEATLLVTYYVEETPGALGAASLGMDECSGRTDTIIIQVQPSPIAQAVAMTICSDEALDYDLDQAITNGVVGTEYTYTVSSSNNAPSAITSAFSDRTTPSSDNITALRNTLTNTTGDDVVVTFQVSTSVNGCPGNDFVFTLTIASEPVIAGNLDATVCSGTPIGINLSLSVDPDSPAPDSNYTITAIDIPMDADFIPATTNAATGDKITSDSIAMDVFTNFTGIDQTVTYTIVATSAAGCVSDTVEVVATIQPEAFVQNVKDTVCSGVRLAVDIVNDLAVTNPSSTVSFQRRRLAGLGQFFVIDGNDNNMQISFDANGVQDGPSVTDTDLVIRDSIINGTGAGFSLFYDITVTDANTCSSNSFVYEVLVLNEVNATLTANGSSSFCTDETIILSTQLQGSAGVNTQYAYTVVNPGMGVDLNLVPNGSNVTVSANAGSAAGNATIQVIASDPTTGCSSSATTTVTVGLTPAPNPIMGEERPCVNTFTQYTVRDNGNGFQYDWSLSDPSAGQIIPSPADTSFTIVYNSSVGSGPFVITLVETSPDGCETINELVVTLATQLNADYRFQLDNGGNPLSVAFFEQASGNITTYAWDFGDGTTSSDPNPTHLFPDNPSTPGAPFDYDVRLIVNGICAPFTDTITKTITINSVVECQTVALDPGVNFISFGVEPSDSAIASVFGGVPGLIQVTGFSGGFPQVFQPGNGSGNTPNMVLSKGAGYVVIVQQASMLEVCGTAIDPSFKRPLNAGVNYVGYMGDTPESADNYLANLVGPVNNPGPLVVAQTFGNGVTGFADQYIQNGGSSNDLTAFVPNRGYVIIVRSPQGSYRGVPGNTENFEFLHGAINGVEFEEGEEVEVLNSRGNVIAKILPDDNGRFYATPVFGEVVRADGSYVSGLAANETISFRYRGEMIGEQVVFHGASKVTELNLSVEGVTSVDLMESAPTIALSVYPNPIRSTTTIKLVTSTAGRYDLLVMDVNGRVVKQLLTASDQQAGTVTIAWDQVEDLTAGIYNLVLLKDGALIEDVTKRIVKQ